MKDIIPPAPPGLQTQVPPNTVEKKFVPKGAIAFFILLVLLGLFIWFSIYFLMLERT